jgi:hypothetical protein
MNLEQLKEDVKTTKNAFKAAKKAYREAKNLIEPVYVEYDIYLHDNAIRSEELQKANSIYYFNQLRERTLKPENIVLSDNGFYRYVNHIDYLATTGWITKERLLAYTDNLRFDENNIHNMKLRYIDFYENK